MHDMIQGAIERLQVLADALTGISQADVYPPEQLNVFPFVVVYPSAGRWVGGPAGMMKGIHDLVVEIHVQRTDLPRNVQAAMPAGEALAAAILSDPTLGGTVDTVLADNGLAYTFGALAWGGQATIGWRITVPVKIQTVL